MSMAPGHAAAQTPPHTPAAPPTGFHSRRLGLGLGCDRGTPAATLIAAIDEALAQLAPPARAEEVQAVASIDLKADEAGLLAAAAHFGWHVEFHPAATLATLPVPNPSATVLRYTGTPSVAEAAALLAAGGTQARLLLEKHKKRGPDGRHATVSIACGPADRHPPP